MRNLAILFVLLSSSLVLASGSTGSRPNYNTDNQQQSFRATRSLTATVIALEAPNRVIVRNKSGQKLAFVVGDKTNVRGKKKLFDGRNKLAYGDLAVGQTVKMSYLPTNGELTYVKVVALPKHRGDS